MRAKLKPTFWSQDVLGVPPEARVRTYVHCLIGFISQPTIAIICALPLEVDVVDAHFDECYDNLEETEEDELPNCNISTIGRIERHFVALVQLPGIGKSSAAGVTSTLLLNFTGIRLVLVVGICGGVPFPSKRTELSRDPAGFERKGGEKCNNDRNLKSFITNLKTKKLRNRLQEDISSHLSYLHGMESDWAYPDCEQLGCDGELVQRDRLKERGTAPFIHFGKIASADTVMKSGNDRDKLAHDEGIIGSECISLFLSLPLIRRPGVFRSFMSKRTFHKVNDWLPSYLSRAPSQHHPVFSLIWTINKWNEQEHDSDIWSQRATTIIRVLKASQEKLNPPPLIMLILVQVLVNFFRFKSSCGRQTIAEISSSDTLEIESSLVNITLSGVDEETRECTVQPIHSFRYILDFETNDPVFKDAVILYAEMRCVSYLSITEFWEQAHGPLINDPQSMSLTHLSQKDRSLLISVSCMLQWEKPTLRNFEDVRRVYEFGISQAINHATLIPKGLRLQAKQVWVPIRSYISNSWGRNGSEFMASAPKSTEMDDIISPYLERTVLGVIESFSDPQSY
ncbi:hypothetical protein TSTA_042470 [Talaromyces stipitatus ATCC 10500]|uniref:Nucleoside phosphorylase domain-containing protein n=1 Tax=Talaromyces stipitatus (strain ATCC 10500 / CBS 375.48 / QM 6759 / NRRL 1006) TaxID=441959 RepID=B8MJV6_TALSN|nr:uncharacterized protein TSTA_042470 [Talaromyces stipitatus ATCC 10500]EED14773.1 hypothetical protein TSTA_042470 [Talaromyces stipitatus ATCC 10500]